MGVMMQPPQSVERSSPPTSLPPAIALLRSTLPREGKLPASPWASGSRAPVLLLGNVVLLM